ncbi:hypothetical protein PR202_ga28870 [Eleusine coracana subsp. coracana]|uniref:Uncharacterized protein n=1 Tax=Eleusine coracana subsp. coracana TaxID=191504 RepID=A0AAV5DKL4_ELECO|nr:hypothetical protein PR202_ga28870 [Eleusine coracana subsp. coracana]
MSRVAYYIVLLAGVLIISASETTLLPRAAAEDVFQGSFCSKKANEKTSDDAYRSNLRALAALLVAGARTNNSAVGAGRLSDGLEIAVKRLGPWFLGEGC